MEQFSVEEYLKDPSKKVITQEGEDVRILCVDRKNTVFPVVALCYNVDTGQETCRTYTADGRCFEKVAYRCDLFFAPEKKEGWINLYRNSGGFLLPSRVYQSKEVAEKRGSWHDCYVTTTKIEWEE